MDLGLDDNNDANATGQSQAGFPDYEADAGELLLLLSYLIFLP